MLRQELMLEYDPTENSESEEKNYSDKEETLLVLKWNIRMMDLM
jgi:hypothetical protein